ncbi:MAG: peptidoglycan bridge formation glycyltransferase FemA/FemB family protein [Chloroflexi bacterium]|jgi:peptidoglycan pentaglycine glycine transferase (the first glycine)|nr:peptidoglycan bridge formation glycyltransferase FemA/FemB family protein [Chloroflexota bacterium]MBT3670925.1 peptidoglycan bridge formation glycyltransferase FemA/FemB family protein [Chloroflexota bacterium]MBT4306361.1 peptidoglycan bridge formation glycyltransferase FemA/FemB family protein [Chloroflexota bacterium]MBT4532758.1 peptidoglycan bridge formation glycyltransferase FemA/FemB family protein [Chloroflexota bacterium]MBT4683006.1 peptidoglycan bridge formation glycyltransferase
MDKNTWNNALRSFPAPQLLQTFQWGELKVEYGWQPIHKTWEKNGEIAAMALILKRSIQLPGPIPDLQMLYIPKGPVMRDWGDAELRKTIIQDLENIAKEQDAFLIKIEPDVLLGTGEPESEDATENAVGDVFINDLKANRWHYSKEQIQFKNTVLINLLSPEDEILAKMKQKTRYNIRLAERKGVTVRKGDPSDFEMLFKTYAETAIRDGFTIRNKEYYLSVWNRFYDAGMLTPLIADVEGDLVAGLMLFHFGETAWYIYGMSKPTHRNKMPTYLLQWEAIKTAKALGCRIYDLWGAPETFDESDSFWGVYRFKRGLEGEVNRHIGAWDLPIRPWIYWAYSQVLPRMMSILRRKGNRETESDAL